MSNVATRSNRMGAEIWSLERVTWTLIKATAVVKSEGSRHEVEKAGQGGSPLEFGCAEQQDKGVRAGSLHPDLP